MAWKSKESPLPPASLHLLVPPVRLMSAFIWQAVQQHNVMKYDKLGDFITLVTEMVPDILSNRKRAGLIISLRARLILELCRSDGVAHQQTIRNHLDKIHSCCAALNSTDQMVSRDVLKTSYANFAHLVQNLLNIPFEKELFFNEVFPKIYGPDFNQRLQQLVFEFLSRLEELLPIPDLQQTAAWFAETSSVSEAFEQHLSEPFGLKTLLLHHKQLVAVRSAPPSREEDVRWSGLVLPAPAGNQTEILEWEYLSEDSQSSDVAADDSVPRGESGSLSGLFVCPQCSFTHRRKRKVQEHIQSEHHLIAPIQEETSVRTQTARSAPMREDAKKKKKKKSKHKGYAEKEQQHKNMKQIVRRTEVLGDDRRFLTTRPVTKNFTEEETKCPKCEKVFEHPNQLRTHLKLHSLPYRCSQCEKGFSSVSGYHQHQRLHKRGRVFTCGQCNKGFLCSYSLKQHERLHEGPTCVCTVCGRGFSKAGIVRHMQMHRGERNYLCTTCGKSFLSSGELMLHTRSHTGDTPYTCSHCGKGFSSKSHLSVHTRSHTGERPYLCAECPKRFLTLNCLKRHALSHNGVKPFKCPCCEREFSQQGNMKRHLATHKPDPSSVCPP